ncbi:MAG: sulfotransferase domain-containing protein [Planctomycetota bacterium]
MPLIQKIRNAAARFRPARPQASQSTRWHAPTHQAWNVVGTPTEHQAATPVLHAAGFTPESKRVASSANPTDGHAVLLLTGSTDPTHHAAHRFLDQLAALHTTTPPDTPIHHPAVLAADLARQYANLYAVVGYPGTGNIVLQGVLAKIEALRAANDSVANTPAWKQAQHYAQHHAEVTHVAAEQLLAKAGQTTGHTLEKLVLAPGHLGQCSVRATLTQSNKHQHDDQASTTFLLNHLPYAGFLNRPYGAHSRWDAEAADFFPAFGYRRVYLAVRNPLAVLCSNAAKTVRPLEHALHDRDWFQPTAPQIAEYHADAKAVLETHPNAYRVIRYEDLIQRPRETIQQLGRDADLELTDAQADDIWKDVGFKSLTPAGDEHLFKPTADKRPHFRPVHADWLADAGLDAAFTDHGYAVPQRDDFPDQPLEQRNTQIQKRPSALYGRIDHRAMHSIRHRPLQLWIRSNEPALAETFLATLQGSPYRRLLTALDDRFGKLHLPPRRR